jgi:hypothetical protein
MACTNEHQIIKDLIKDVYRCIQDKTLSQTSVWLYFGVMDTVRMYLTRNPDDDWIAGMYRGLRAVLQELFPMDWEDHGETNKDKSSEDSDEHSETD